MNKDEITLEAIFPTTSKQLYTDWLNSEGHSNFTGGEAKATNKLGASFTAWDGYITGSNLSLEQNFRIVQSWRTSEFSNDEEDSKLELTLDSISSDQVKLTLNHSNIPKGDGEKYKLGWIEHYFEPMLNYYKQD